MSGACWAGGVLMFLIIAGGGVGMIALAVYMIERIGEFAIDKTREHFSTKVQSRIESTFKFTWYGLLISAGLTCTFGFLFMLAQEYCEHGIFGWRPW